MSCNKYMNINNIKQYAFNNKYFILAVIIIILVIVSIHFKLYKLFVHEKTIVHKERVKQVTKKDKHELKPQKKVTFEDNMVCGIGNNNTCTINNNNNIATNNKIPDNTADIDSLMDIYSLDNISKVDTFSEVPSEIINLDGFEVNDNDKIFEKV